MPGLSSGLRSTGGEVTGAWVSMIGAAAGLATSFLWTATSLLFTSAGRRIGPTAVNGSRIVIAVALHGLTHRLLTGAWLPEAASGQLAYLAASAVIGLAIGDQALFTAFIDVGPRIAMLCMATAPLFAVAFGWLALGETLSAWAGVGVVLTMAGVAWVVLERPAREVEATGGHRLRGVLLALFAAACQAGGLLLSKQGIGHGWLPADQHLSPQSATLIRMLFAGVGVAPIVVWHALRQRGRTAEVRRRLRIGTKPVGYLLTLGGSIVGPFLGVWMSLEATDRIAVGVAQTLCSLPPVLILPFVIIVYKERVSARAALGAALAVTGVAVLFLTA